MSVITVLSGGDLQAAINSAVPENFIELQAGATWDGTFGLPNAGASAGNPITIRSQNYASLPSSRVSPSDASNMPRIRTLGVDAAACFVAASSAAGWVLDGLELTDNAGTGLVNMLVDFSFGAGGMTMTRCYCHQKETGTTYTRSVIRVMAFEGVGLIYTKNYIEDFIGIPYGGSTEPLNSEGLASVGGQDILLEDNYISVWYNGIILGGGDTAPTHTATLTSASLSQATFSNVTGLEVDAFIRFSVAGTATLSNAGPTPTITRVTGEAWVPADGNQNGNWGDSCFLTSVADPTRHGITRLMTLTGNNVFTTTAANSSVDAIPNGAVTYEIYQTAKVTAINGNVVTYNPLGTTAGINYDVNALQHIPASAAWCQGDQGRVVDVTLRKNTFYINPVFASYLQSIGRGCPKGVFEIKSCDRFLFEGNYVLGYPATMAFTAANQNGSAPWITVNNVVIQNNWIAPDTGYSPCSRSAMLITDDAYLNTITPTVNVLITNNLMIDGIRSLATIKNGDFWILTHNTCLNGQQSDSSGNDLIDAQDATIPAMTFTSNIGQVVCYGFNGYPAAFVTPTILNNVLIDANANCSGGISTSTYGVGSGLAPIPTADSQVGFTDLLNNVYSLAAGSPYKGQGLGGADPGVNWTALLAALGPSPTSAGVSISGTVVISGPVTIGG